MLNLKKYILKSILAILLMAGITTASGYTVRPEKGETETRTELVISKYRVSKRNLHYLNFLHTQINNKSSFPFSYSLWQSEWHDIQFKIASALFVHFTPLVPTGKFFQKTHTPSPSDEDFHSPVKA